MLSWLMMCGLDAARSLLAPIPLAVMTVLIFELYQYYTKNYDFWKARGVAGPRATAPWGNEFGPPFWKPILQFEDWMYNQNGGKKYCGYFQFRRPILFVGEPDLIRAITIKDFEYFTNRRDTAVDDNFSEALTVLNGEKWKTTRAVMSPSFSASKLKAMHQMTLDNAQNLAKYVLEEMEKHNEVEIKDSFGKFTMDNVASCAFGVNCNSFVDPNSTFATNASKLFSPGTAGLIHALCRFTLPKCIVDKLPNPAGSVIDFFASAVNKTIRHREANPSSTRDFLQLLMDTKDSDGNCVLTSHSVFCQSLLFFIVGYDTTATLLTFAAYCMATEPEYQRRVQQEIDNAVERHGGEMTYDAVLEMTYLDRVLSETLRLYPPGILLERESSKDYTLPNTNVHLPKGTLVQMSVYQIQHDPDHYPDPYRFDPDRFLPEQKEQRHPCAYLPFGSGPRNCIAMRFALFEAKVALAAVLRQLTLSPSDSTPPPPCPLDSKSFILAPEGRKMPLKAVLRNKAN